MNLLNTSQVKMTPHMIFYLSIILPVDTLTEIYNMYFKIAYLIFKNVEPASNVIE